MSTVFTTAKELLESEGTDLGSTEYVAITQEQINQFADATGDHQWIHVDPERARKGPFGACIAHGYLTLSLANLFLPQLMRVDNTKMGINYGCDKVRFPSVVKVGSKIRGSGQVVATELRGEAVQVTVRISIEVEASDRPACVVDTISRFIFN